MMAVGANLLLAIVAVCILAAGQTVDRPQFKAAASGVRLAAWILRDGRTVGNLGNGDLELHDNGVRQNIDVTEVRNGSLDVALVTPAAAVAERALAEAHRGFVRSRLRWDDTFRALTAHSGATAPEDTAHDRPPLSSNTTIVDASLAAVLRFSSTPDLGDRLRVLFVLAGRDADDSWARPADLSIATQQLNVVLVLGLLRDLGFDTVIASGGGTVSYARSGRPVAPTPSQPLRELATTTGGRVLDLRHLAGQTELAAVIDQLRSHYVVTYVPAGVTREGWHEVRLGVRKGRGYSVIARSGYRGTSPATGSALLSR
jgi:hypothetical protein